VWGIQACFAKYGSTSLRGKHCHELALRIVLSSIETHANRYKRHIVSTNHFADSLTPMPVQHIKAGIKAGIKAPY
jgi:hypothetical protein